MRQLGLLIDQSRRKRLSILRPAHEGLENCHLPRPEPHGLACVMRKVGMTQARFHHRWVLSMTVQRRLLRLLLWLHGEHCQLVTV